jgi:hypothetical protein
MQITSSSTAIPLKLVLHTAVGMFICSIIMIAVYFGNAWDSKSLPFMSTNLLRENGTAYPIKEVFPHGTLDKSVFAKYGLPQVTGTFAFSLFMANAAVSVNDIHHAHMLNAF